jgi:hypothetical protein
MVKSGEEMIGEHESKSRKVLEINVRLTVDVKLTNNDTDSIRKME